VSLSLTLNPWSASSRAAKGAGELGSQQRAREPAVHQGVSKVLKGSNESEAREQTRNQAAGEPARNKGASKAPERQQ